MPSYKLTYFNGRGRGELSRMVFAAAEKKFEDKRIEFSDWPALKAEMPQGTMPVLEVDGKRKISQSVAIARYLAREFNMYGKGNAEMAIVDQIVDTCLDVFTPFVKIAFNPDKEEKAKQMEEFYSSTLPKLLGFLENLVKETGKSGFAVGSSLTLGDLALYTYIENCGAGGKLEKFPLLAANRKKVEELPRIKTYLKNRPVTEF
ncbi:glutathione S-transferase-like [Mercenaria mercenaria]|uniref:glutathione S-transferase-like n=1 Tax=Mercenaria mercenaria TaxID=6596 RepID=UPI00234F5575|nr:glutathione S-transferase-like [Mercenaria mercenaria]